MTKERIAVFFLSLAVALLASPKLTSQILRVPQGHVFVGMTTYFEDFYYYLDQFYQGKTGNWLTENRFSIERFPPTLVYINHIILGKIGGLFGLEAFQSYNLFGFLFKWLFIYLAFIPIKYLNRLSVWKRLSVYLVFLFSTAVPRFTVEAGRLVYRGGYDAFRAENRIMARFGTAPNGMLINVTFLAALFVAFRIGDMLQSAKRQRGNITVWGSVFVLLVGYLTLTDASKAAILLVVLCGLYWFELKGRLTAVMRSRGLLILTAAGAMFLVVLAVILRTVESDPVYAGANAWDVQQYLSQFRSDWKSLLLGFGFQIPFLALGYITLWRKRDRSIYESAVLYLVGFVVSAYLGPMILQIPVPGFRFMFPAVYPFFAFLVVTGMERIGSLFRGRWVYRTILIAYLITSIGMFSMAWYRDIQPPKEPDFHFTYIPKPLYDGLMYLKTAEPRSANVLASPYTSIDLMIPGLTGRYTYSGHMLTTYKSQEKDKQALGFFFDWTDSMETRDFLKRNNIGFVVVTKYSALLKSFYQYYATLLTPVYSNSYVTIFKVDPK